MKRIGIRRLVLCLGALALCAACAAGLSARGSSAHWGVRTRLDPAPAGLRVLGRGVVPYG